jgi:PPM family protein phosphatase
MTLEIGSALDTGIKRRGKENQDAIGIQKPSFLSRRPHLLVIADGMGGYEGGAVASRQVVQSFNNVYLRTSPEVSPLQVLQMGVTDAHRSIQQLAMENPRLVQMGSTVVATIIKEEKIYLVNVGDSRAYIINDSEVRQISWDHSFVGEALRRGVISEAQLRTHPRRNVLTMSISVQRESIETFTGIFEWKKNDRLMMCSDGLWGSVTEAQMQAVVLELAPQLAADKLVHLANTNQGPDNISVVIAQNK